MKRFSRRRQKGAIFVEAIVVISSLTLLLLSMVFFKQMYLKKLRVMRLARATVIAYSMQGCPEGQDPAQWASIDLDRNAGKNTTPPTKTPLPAPNQEANPSKRAGDIMKEIPGAGSNGSTVNPIADLGLSMKASATTKTSRLSSRKGYSATMTSTSFVSCSEGIRDDGFKGIVGYAKSKFNLFKGNEPPDN